MILCYYYKKQYWDLPPYEKKAKPLDPQPDLPKPRWRPGFWLEFHDRLVPNVTMVGKLRYVVSTETGRERWYQIDHGATMHHVAEANVVTRMIPENR